MSSPSQLKEIIRFYDGTGQRRQVRYHIVPSPFGIADIVFDKKIIFVADPDDGQKSDPDISLGADSDISSVLVNKVLLQDLSHCRLDFIEVFFVTEPDTSGRREAFRWNFKVDIDNPIGDDPFRTTFPIYRSRWDWLKALFRIPGAVFETKGLTDGPNQRAGIYPVQVDINKPVLPEKERLEILLAIDLGFGSL